MTNNNNGRGNRTTTSTRGSSVTRGTTSGTTGAAGGRTMGTGGVDGIPDSDTPAAMTSAGMEHGDPANLNAPEEVRQAENDRRAEAGLPHLDERTEDPKTQEEQREAAGLTEFGDDPEDAERGERARARQVERDQEGATQDGQPADVNDGKSAGNRNRSVRDHADERG
jgi:hypothetical protein